MQLIPSTYVFSQLRKLMAYVLGCIWESGLRLNVSEGVNHGNNNKPSTFRTLYLSRKDLHVEHGVAYQRVARLYVCACGKVVFSVLSLKALQSKAEEMVRSLHHAR